MINSLGNLLNNNNQKQQIYSKAYVYHLLKKGLEEFLGNKGLQEKDFNYQLKILELSEKICKVVLNTQSNQFATWLSLETEDLKIFLVKTLLEKKVFAEDAEIDLKIKTN